MAHIYIKYVKMIKERIRNAKTLDDEKFEKNEKKQTVIRHYNYIDIISMIYCDQCKSNRNRKNNVKTQDNVKDSCVVNFTVSTCNSNVFFMYKRL